MGTGFTYQGRLTEGGAPANGAYDFTFALYDDPTAGTQVGGTVTRDDVNVSDGLFTVTLDFGDVFDGTALYLEIGVRPGTSSGAYTTLTPRQPLTAAPYAAYARRAPWSGLSGVPEGFADGVDDDTTYTAGTGMTLSGNQFSLATSYRLPQTCTNGQVAQWNGSAWTCASGGSGDITAVYAGTGLTDGGTSGDVTLAADTNYLQRRVTGACPAGQYLKAINADGSVTCEPDDNTTYTAGTGMTLSGNQFSVNTAVIQARVTGTCSSGNAIRVINADGTVTCEAIPGAFSGWSLTGNSGTTAGTNFVGTTDNVALEFKVNNARALRLEPNATSPNLIGGYSGNSVTSGVVGATIGGGGASGYTNSVTAGFGTVGGGYDNTASGYAATVGGGRNNTASISYATVGGGDGNIASDYAATAGGGGSNTASALYATVGGGYDNTASGYAATVGGGFNNTASVSYATVGGGNSNSASGWYATVGGGDRNTASGNYATVGGGYSNVAAGDYSFVVGLRAKNTNTAHDGVFLFADSNNFDFPSTAANQFRVRATGGAQFVLGINSSDGTPTWTCSVSNGGSWSCSSDRNLKENLALADSRAILKTLSRLPLYTWSAKGGDPSVRHLGPMAQDFYAAFELGDSDVAISTIDLDGVALAAIQGLYQVVQEKDAEITNLQSQISTLQSQISTLQSQNATLEARLSTLEQRVGGTAQPGGSSIWGIAAALLIGALGVVGYERVRRGGRK